MTIEVDTLKNLNNCLNAISNSYLEASGGQSSNLYCNVVHFFNTSVSLDIYGSLRLLFSCIGVWYELFYLQPDLS